jgi:hypothetical protein
VSPPDSSELFFFELELFFVELLFLPEELLVDLVVDALVELGLLVVEVVELLFVSQEEKNATVARQAIVVMMDFFIGCDWKARDTAQRGITASL